MNWSLVAMMALTLMIIGVIAITIIFFIRHWANRAGKQSAVQPDNEGTYFVRLLPPGTDNLQPKEQSDSTPQKNYRKAIQYGLSLAFVLGLALLLGAATYMNRDNLLAKIELSEQELSAMTFEEHEWSQQEFQQLPELTHFLNAFKAQEKGITLVYTEAVGEWPARSINPFLQGKQHWLTFAKQHQLDNRVCAWSELDECSEGREHWLYILLPGQWDARAISQFVNTGKQLLVYGPPQQIFSGKGEMFRLSGLTFKSSLSMDQTGLVLQGDRELTLGFDAGMMIKAQSGFEHFRAESSRPQAIAINHERAAGAKTATRLYAEAFKNRGRLVWMDFSPNVKDHDAVIPYYLDSVIASVFRYMEGSAYTAWSTWPEGKRFAALIEEDTEEQYHNAEPVADYFREKNYPITWFVLSNKAMKNRELTEQLAASGEIACYGDNRLAFTRHSLEVQQQRIARCMKVVQALTGKKVTAFRPPQEAHNRSTLDAMYNNGIQHFIAEIAKERFTPVVYGHPNDEAALISLPRMSLNDHALWGETKTPDDMAMYQLRQEADWVKQIGGLFTFNFHTQYMGDKGHLQIIKDLADYIHENEAYFATARDIANWWRLRVDLIRAEQPSSEALEKYQPVLLSVDSQGKLQRKVVTNMANVSQVQQRNAQ
ncbi:MAG: polysaccharide deacetylase family protein [Thiolinea sp.]